MNEAALRQLYFRYLQGETTESESAELIQILAAPENRALAEELLSNSFTDLKPEHELSPEKEDQILKNIFEYQSKKTRKKLWPCVAVAASILLALTFFMFLNKHPQKEGGNSAAQLVRNDIAPGHNQATLTLANGQKIVLTKGLSGQLATQNKTTINATQNTIVYDAKNQTGELVSYNTLSTARGEQSPYPLVLADGTKVWLNAESSITFPTAFNQKERIVKITGEAFFEVKHNEKQPFKVQTATQTIEDIGTSFNVNAYADESNTKTTLVEGSVKVNDLTLKPNQQTDGTHIKTVNTDNYTAWKEGNFHFEGDNIQTVMRQLARWYNIDVAYEGNISNEVFYADITRNKNISAIMKVLQNTKGIHFKIEGRRVTVIE